MIGILNSIGEFFEELNNTKQDTKSKIIKIKKTVHISQKELEEVKEKLECNRRQDDKNYTKDR
ncbi:MAG: hypothetical protein OQL19_17685 [Gammaproteobacteria bacterium]|nr:hypothetical protein [Gammaproteobacteria bacterium]